MLIIVLFYLIVCFISFFHFFSPSFSSHTPSVILYHSLSLLSSSFYVLLFRFPTLSFHFNALFLHPCANFHFEEGKSVQPCAFPFLTSPEDVNAAFLWYYTHLHAFSFISDLISFNHSSSTGKSRRFAFLFGAFFCSPNYFLVLLCVLGIDTLKDLTQSILGNQKLFILYVYICQ